MYASFRKWLLPATLVPFQLIAAKGAEECHQPAPRLGGLALPALAAASAPGEEHPPGLGPK